MAFAAGFSRFELNVIALRTQGVRPVEIAKRLGRTRRQIYQALSGIHRKVGVQDIALLTRWAMKWGFDELLGAETPAERPYPGTPKPRQKRIKLGRMRGTGTTRRETRMS